MEAAVLAGITQYGCEIETEAVDPQSLTPVSEGIDDEVLSDCICGVVVAANSGVIPRVLAISSERVVSGIVETPPTQQIVSAAVRGMPGIAFTGVVIDDINEDLQPSGVEG